MNILIVAGGQGTRLWPASRKSKPKQLLTLLNDKTLLQNTYDRAIQIAQPEDIFIATTKAYTGAVAKQLPQVPKKNYSIEPVLRDRGPAIGLAALIIHHKNPNGTFVTAWSDSHIEPEQKFTAILKKAEKFLSKNPKAVLNIGVRPSFPHTGMGHLEKGAAVANKEGLKLFSLKSWKEKPNIELAKKFTKSGRYLWNTGMFIWKTERLLSLYEQHLPKVYALLMQIKPHVGTPKQQAAINRIYPKMPHTDIESNLIEKIQHNIYAIEADFTWGDIGGWRVIKDMQSKPNSNVSKGLHLDHDSHGVLVYNYDPKHLIATLGLKNIVVVHTNGATLIAEKKRSEEIKELIKKIKSNKKLGQYL